MGAARHIPPQEITQFRRQHRCDVFLLGLGITGLFMIPVINLIAPLVGAAAAVHSFHTAMGERRAWRAGQRQHSDMGDG